MARVTHVRKAQQRYATVAVLDEQGQPKQTPVMDKRTGQQKTDKRGRPVTMKVTRADKTQPLPMPVCESCDETIEVGTAYKHITPKSGPYGGRTRYRHEGCPTWNVWDYSNSLSARIAQIQHSLDEALDNCQSIDDVESALEDAASEAESLAEEKEEAASNIEDGFGHETEKSQELNDQAEGLNEWAGELRDALDNTEDFEEEGDCEECGGEGSIEDTCIDCEGLGQFADDESETDESECENCEGTGTVSEDCDECDGTGSVTHDFAEWMESNRDGLMVECNVG